MRGRLKKIEALVKRAFKRLIEKLIEENREIKAAPAIYAASRVAKQVPLFFQSPLSSTQQEEDAFRMKAVKLLRENGFTSGISPEVFQIPIKTNVVKEPEGQKVVVTLTQEIVRAGEKFQLVGVFIRDPEKSKYSIPMPSSFKIGPLGP